MTDNAAPTTTPATGARSGGNAGALLGIGVLLGGFVIYVGNTDLQKGDNGGLVPAIISAVILLVAAALFWFLVLPRVRNVGRSVIIISVVAILSIVVFWLGITPLLAAAAVAAGGKPYELPKPALVLEVLAVIAAVANIVVSIAQSRVF